MALKSFIIAEIASNWEGSIVKATKLIKRICFDYLKFVELHIETYDIRDNLIKI